MSIESLRKYRGRNPNGYFEDLPADVRFRARRWLAELLERRKRQGKPTPQWTFAILVGQAKRLASQSKEERSAWGRSMLAKRGGYAVQQRYRIEGKHPAAKATKGPLAKQPARQGAAQPCIASSQRQPSVFFNLPIGF
ncbi:MAG: hypothetical protein CXZ00_02525 [Acidobacteria bacterium]|nr:MAG: hypothetical protein CXZ00_02525 [Acidobacteriota bacterium]